MKLTCSNGHEVEWRDAECPHCGEGLTLLALLGRTLRLVKRGPLIKCTATFCEKAYPLSYKECPFCTTENSLQNAVDSVIEPIGEATQRAIKTRSPETKRRFQRAYLILSFFVLCFALSHSAKSDGDEVGKSALMAVLYLGCLALLIRWFVPQKLIITFLLRTTWVVKLALIFNYLACLILLQVVIAGWWAQFVGLAILVGLTWGGVWVFCRLLWSMNLEMKNIFLFGKEDSSSFNHLGDQGRKGFWDRGGPDR